MKRFFALMMSVLLILTISQASIVTLYGPDCTVTMNSPADKEITLSDLKGGIRWWKVLSGGVDVTDNKFVMPETDVEVQPMYEGNQIVVRQTSNGTITPGTTETTEGSNYAFTITPNSGYKIVSLIVDGVSKTVTNETGMTYTFTNVQENHIITATYEVGATTEGGANAPVLADGLAPVNWNGSVWETTTEANWDYNYNSVAEATHSTVAGNGDGKWANAQTADGSLYVWIPRYSYKITSGEHSNGNSWNSLDNPGTNKIEVKFSNGTTDDTSNSYIKHPAFTFGTDELQGIWVAKYEASQGNTTSETSVPTSSTSVAKSIPGVASWRSITVSNMFDYAYNTYRNADSHLMKNVEWGAVAYLTNAIGRIPYINNSSDYITGNAGGSQNASEAAGTTNAWNTAGGVKASTTHNVYGIYDMSGGAREYVAAYVNNGNSNLSTYASSLVNAATKYKDVYPIGSSDSEANNYAAWSSIKGDAVYETSSSSSSTASWDRDYSNAPDSNYPVFNRGGLCSSASGAGVFCSLIGNGNAGSLVGFRVVLGIKAVAPTTYTITYNLDGGTVTGNPTTYTSNDTITLVNPTKEGYTFKGWTGTGLTEATTSVTIPVGSTGDREYTATYLPISYTIKYNGNGATSGSMSDSSHTYGVAKALTTNSFSRTGYNFLGWSTSSSATTATYTNGQSVSNLTTTSGATVNLYAVWEEDSGIDLATIPVGSYIAYQPSNTSCTVLASDSGNDTDQTYNPSSITSWKVFKNNDGQLDIISSESVGSLYLCEATGYAKAVYTLNKMCSDYVNPTYATSGRSLGYKAGSSMETIDTDTYPLTWDYTYNQGNTGFPYTDTYYTDDQTIINTAVDGTYPLRHSSGYVWFASRNLGALSSSSYFQVRSLNASGSNSADFLHNSSSDGSTTTNFTSNGVRPVVSLKSGIQIKEGDGTSANPYIIQ